MRTWFRWYEGTTEDPKFRLIAHDSNQPTAFVVSVWAALLEKASENEDRGSIAGFDCDVVDVMYDMPAGTAESIVAAMIQRGMISDGRVTNWDSRQCTRKPATFSSTDGSHAKSSTERSRAYRQRKKAAATSGNGDATDATPLQRDATPCNVATVARNENATECNGDATPDPLHATKSNAEITLESSMVEGSATVQRNATACNGDATEFSLDKIRLDNIKDKNTNTPIPPQGGACECDVTCDTDASQHVTDADAYGTAQQLPAAQPPARRNRPKKLDAPSKSDPRRAGFMTCYQVYPVQQGQEAAWREWCRLSDNGTLEQPHVIRESILRMTQEDSRWQSGYVPKMATWLHDKGWEDQPYVQPAPASIGGQPAAPTEWQLQAQTTRLMARGLLERDAARRAAAAANNEIDCTPGTTSLVAMATGGSPCQRCAT